MPTLIYGTLKWLMRNKKNTNADNVFEHIYASAVQQQQIIDKNTLIL